MVVAEAEAEAAAPSTSALATSRNPNDICFADVCTLFEKIRGVNKTGFKAGVVHSTANNNSYGRMLILSCVYRFVVAGPVRACTLCGDPYPRWGPEEKYW